MAVVERSATCLLRVKYSLIRAKKSASVRSVSLAMEWTVKVTRIFFAIFFNDIVCLFLCQKSIASVLFSLIFILCRCSLVAHVYNYLVFNVPRIPSWISSLG